MTSEEREIEEELRSRNLNAPRLSPERIDSVIISEEFHVFHGKHMVCCLTLLNGFTVIGESAVVSPENFREDIGKRLARGKARDKVWGMEAYLLQQREYENSPGGNPVGNHIHGK